MGIVIAYSLATFLTSVFACVPVASFWDPTIKGSCVNLKAVWSVERHQFDQILVWLT